MKHGQNGIGIVRGFVLLSLIFFIPTASSH